MTTTDLATKDLTEKQLAELEESIGNEGLKAEPQKSIPLLKLAQGLTRADVAAGHYFNSATEHDYGDSAELIVVASDTGRFLAVRGEGEYTAVGDVAPSNWPDIYAGKRFTEIPDAEETFRARANAGEIEWGGGPPISTTTNFFGFVPEHPALPVRLSLMRSNNPAAQKIDTILRWSNKPPWSNVVALTAKATSDKQDNPYYIVAASQGRKATVEERQNAVALFQIIQSSQFKLEGTESDADLDAKRKGAAAADPDALDM